MQNLQWWLRQTFRECSRSFDVFSELVRVLLTLNLQSNGVDSNISVLRIQRPYVEKQLHQTLSSEDVLNRKTSLSHFAVLEWRERPIGCVALDATSINETAPNLDDAGLVEKLVLAQKATNTNTFYSADSLGGSEPKTSKKVKPAPKLSGRSLPSTFPNHTVNHYFHVDQLYIRAGVQYEPVQAVFSDIFSGFLTVTPSPTPRL